MDGYLQQIIAQYFSDVTWEVVEGASGMNNTTKFLKVYMGENCKQYILRIYESHQEQTKVNFEQEILQALAEVELSFSVPYIEKNLVGERMAYAPDGKLVSLARYIKGQNPRLDNKVQCECLGKVVGELTKALSKITVKSKPAYATYYDLETAYPECALEEVIHFCMMPPVGFDKEKLHKLGEHFIQFQKVLPLFKALPHQLSHGDINASNVLEDDNGTICAILDFEFATWDLRIIDLAVCLSEMINQGGKEEELLQRLGAFIKGYGQEVVLEEAEIRLLPELLILRRLDVFIHFLVRHKKGISNDYKSAEDILKEQVTKASIICDWVSANREAIYKCVQSR